MADDSFKDFVEDQLRALGGLIAKRMFGGYGLYRGAIFFGIIHDGRLYFKTDTETCKRYIDKGMHPFRPNDNQTLKNYYEVPPEVVDDAEELMSWAREALAVKTRSSGRTDA